MDTFVRKEGKTYCEGVALEKIAAEVGTPAYVYSKATVARHCERLLAAFSDYPVLPCFAVKANRNLSVLSEIFSAGFGADLVSIGELERALLAGVEPKKIVYAGVGKRDDEIARALDVGILAFNVESEYELRAIERLASSKSLVAPVSLRINPNIDAKTNPKITTGLYTSKFGLTEDEATRLMTEIKSSESLKLIGLSCHIGSQMVDIAPISEAAKRMTDLAIKAQGAGHKLDFINMGGGLGIRYKNEVPPSLTEYAEALTSEVKRSGLKLLIEPGRVVVGNAGVLVARVLGVKKTPVKHFVVLDAGMNDLLRPSIYESIHDILPDGEKSGEDVLCDFVGPICESGDYLGKDRMTPCPVSGELYYVRGCGAYAASMASQYNSRPRAPEVLVDGDTYTVIRPRETLESLWESELSALKRK